MCKLRLFKSSLWACPNDHDPMGGKRHKRLRVLSPKKIRLACPETFKKMKVKMKKLTTFL